MSAWLCRLWLLFTARWFARVSYPSTHLLPRPTYKLLTPAHVPDGWLIRRTKGPAQFELDPVSNLLFLRPDQLSDPPKLLAEGFSVNLLGQFELENAGWMPSTKEAAAKLYVPWLPPTPSQPPTDEEMHCPLAAEWDVFGLAIKPMHGRKFQTTLGEFQAFVCHAPNCWNYWHYEVRFQNADDQWLHEKYDPKPYSNNKFRLVAEALRHEVRQSALPKPKEALGIAIPWPQTLFDTAAVTAQP